MENERLLMTKIGTKETLLGILKGLIDYSVISFCCIIFSFLKNIVFFGFGTNTISHALADGLTVSTLIYIPFLIAVRICHSLWLFAIFLWLIKIFVLFRVLSNETSFTLKRGGDMLYENGTITAQGIAFEMFDALFFLTVSVTAVAILRRFKNVVFEQDKSDNSNLSSGEKHEN